MPAAATRRSWRHDFLSGFGNAPRKKGKPVENMICLLLASLIAWVLLSSSNKNLTIDSRLLNGPNGYFLIAQKYTCCFLTEVRRKARRDRPVTPEGPKEREDEDDWRTGDWSVAAIRMKLLFRGQNTEIPFSLLTLSSVSTFFSVCTR